MRTLLFCFFTCLTSLYGADSNLVAIVQRTPHKMVATGFGESEATELWVLNKETNRKEFILRDKPNEDPSKAISEIADPVFSPDMRSIYFVSAAWATSGSIQKVDLKSKKVRFLIDGNSVEVIPKGPYKGMLFVDRSLIKFDKKGESLGRDMFSWLVSPNGKPKFEIGLAEGSAVKKFRKLHMQ